MIWTPQGIHNPIVRRPIPSLESIKRAERITRCAVAQSGLRPGVYTNSSQASYESLKAVQSHLLKQIEHEIADFDVLALCSQLYVWHETLVAQNEVLSGEPAMFIQAIRSLIELAVKSCRDTGNPLGRTALDNILALACLTIEWDQIWDQITSGMVSNEVVVYEDSTVKAMPNPIAEKINSSYKQYVESRQRTRDIALHDQLVLPDERFSLTSDDVDVALSGLDTCLSEEVGYGIVDYFRLVAVAAEVCRDSGFDVCGLDPQKFMLHCERVYGVRSNSFSAILRDFTLSSAILRSVSTRDIFTIGRRNRDSRFMRRPIVLIEYGMDSVLLFGHETLVRATERFLKEVMFGRMPVDSWKTKTSIVELFGGIQGSLGRYLNVQLPEIAKQYLGKTRCLRENNQLVALKTILKSEMLMYFSLTLLNVDLSW